MKLNLNMIAVAVALAAAGSANATMNTMTNASGSSLAFVAYDRTGAAVGSFMADLGYDLDSFRPSSAINIAGTVITWNFNTNLISVTGNSAAAAQPTGATTDYATAFSAFKSTVQTSELRWAVIAGNSDTQQFITTGAPTTANLADSGTNSQSNQSTASMVNVDGMYASGNNAGTHATADNGANFSLPSDAAYFAKNGVGSFGQNGNWNNTLKWNAVSANNVASKLFFIDNVPRAGTGTAAEIITYGLGNPSAPATLTSDFSNFQFDIATNTLTWTGMAAPVPEASSVAMMLAGLAGLGFIARRRRAA